MLNNRDLKNFLTCVAIKAIDEYNEKLKEIEEKKEAGEDVSELIKQAGLIEITDPELSSNTQENTQENIQDDDKFHTGGARPNNAPTNTKLSNPPKQDTSKGNIII